MNTVQPLVNTRTALHSLNSIHSQWFIYTSLLEMKLTAHAPSPQPNPPEPGPNRSRARRRPTDSRQRSRGALLEQGAWRSQLFGRIR
jgi:hypothetical protein